jgi:hypothetical protein
MDWRTSASTSVNASAAHGGRIPVSAAIWALNPASVKVSISQSVW